MSHSNLILLFLLIALWRRFLVGGGWLCGWACLLVGLTLWLPAKLCDFPALQVAQLAIWIAALIYLLTGERRASNSPVAEVGGTT